jgi:hypothetical protein
LFKERVLRKIFGHEGDEATGGCRKLHNEELNNFYLPPKTLRIIKMRWMGHVARGGRMGYSLLQVLLTPKNCWKDNIVAYLEV